MKKKFETVINCLINNGENEPLTGIDIAEQFRPEETAREATFRNLNAAFLISWDWGPPSSKAERGGRGDFFITAWPYWEITLFPIVHLH